MPQLSVSPLSSEDGGDAANDSHVQTRITRHSQPVQDDDIDQVEEELGDEPTDGTDVTRCICGHQEYPGPPLTEDTKSSIETISDDAGGLFIQCDTCSVWQHGGCVGIFDEEKTPENYYCELCEKGLHQVMTDIKGYVWNIPGIAKLQKADGDIRQHYSRYLPLSQPEQKVPPRGSVSRDSEPRSKKERDAISRASVDSSAAKRRSTMNSRQAYDEEETLRRVIEESKGDNETGSVTGTRKGKRSRDESEE